MVYNVCFRYPAEVFATVDVACEADIAAAIEAGNYVVIEETADDQIDNISIIDADGNMRPVCA